MKRLILRAATTAFAVGLVGTLACGGSSGSIPGCGGSNINANDSSAPQLTEQCGAGTYLNNNQCVPRPTANSSATTPQKVITQ